jgi:ubiquinone/menaquinone biosynthesis C-methylase UbiE
MFAGRYAELYDVFYGAKSYATEACFVRDCLAEFGAGPLARVFDLACGTGSHAIELEKLGLQVVALDYSADMIAAARLKAAGRGSRIDFRTGDMRDFTLVDAPFDGATCLFDSIGFAHTNDAIRRSLGNVQRHLKPGAACVVEFWHAPAMMHHYDPVRVARWQTDSGEILRISETKLDHRNQLAHVTYRVYELGDAGTYCRFEDTQVNRYFHVAEMKSLMCEAQLVPLKWFAGFARDEKITSDTWHVVAVARRPPSTP